MAPEIPVTITIAAVSEGMPPILAEINIAMAAVTDLGAIDATVTAGEPSIIAIATADPTAVAEPDKAHKQRNQGGTQLCHLPVKGHGERNDRRTQQEVDESRSIEIGAIRRTRQLQKRHE